jgi:hypothetical protein
VREKADLICQELGIDSSTLSLAEAVAGANALAGIDVEESASPISLAAQVDALINELGFT